MCRKLDECDSCMIAKSKQKNVPKETKTKASRPGERLFLDISSMSSESIGGNNYAVLIVDDFSRFKWCFLLKKREFLTEKVLPFLTNIKKNYDLQEVRMDGAQENHTLGNELIKINVTVEYVPRKSPQLNGVVERAIATSVARARAMLTQAGLGSYMRRRFWAEALNTSVVVSNLLTKSGNVKPP